MGVISTVISLQILSVRSCIAYLQSGDIEPSADDDQSYISKTTTIETISKWMLQLADDTVGAAGPAILGWSAITRHMQLRVGHLTARHIANTPDSQPDLSVVQQPDFYEDIVRNLMDLSKSEPCLLNGTLISA